MNSEERGIPDQSGPREARCGKLAPARELSATASSGDNRSLGVTEERFNSGMYRQLVQDTETTTTISQSGRNETMASHIDPTVHSDFDTLIMDEVDKTKAPGVVIFFPHGVLNYSLASFVNKNAYTYSTGGQYPDGNLMRIVGHKGQSARELKEQVVKAGFIPFEELPNSKYCFHDLAFDQLFNLKMIVKMIDANIFSESTVDGTAHYVTLTTTYQEKGFISFLEESELHVCALAVSRWDK